MEILEQTVPTIKIGIETEFSEDAREREKERPKCNHTTRQSVTKLVLTYGIFELLNAK